MNNKKWLTIPELSTYLGVSISVAYGIVAKNEVQSQKKRIGEERRRVTVVDIEEAKRFKEEMIIPS